MKTYDFVVVGGGIVGVSTAWQLQKKYPDATIALLEKETSLARHQTGRNSGVIHAGVYYQPGSLKADFCKKGAQQTMEFCQTHGLPFLQCGKLLVATNNLEIERMEALDERCRRNSIIAHRLSQVELQEEEPHIQGKAALLIPATGITDYAQVTQKMAECFLAHGGSLELGKSVTKLSENSDCVEIECGNCDEIQAGYLVVCGGLMADRLAKKMGIGIDFQIVPFRGEYYQLPAHKNSIVNHLIYPLPDPDLPFLGVHLTRMIDGAVTVGPNAVLGLKREGYGRVNINLRDTREMLAYRGFWRVVQENWRSGLGELKDSIVKSGYLKRVRKYCPGITHGDLSSYPVGIRAQAVTGDGTLVHDFLFAETERSLHVCNAPSPAATSAIPIGQYLCKKVSDACK